MLPPRTLTLVPLLMTIFGAGCESVASVPGALTSTPKSPWSDAAAGVHDARLATLCTDAWEYRMASDPVGAMLLGDPRYLGRLPDNSQSGSDANIARIGEFMRRAEAIPTFELADKDRTTLRFLYDAWKLELDEHALGIDVASWNIDPRGGPQLDFLTLAEDQPTVTTAEREALLERWEAMAVFVDRARANLRRGLAAGRVTSRNAATEVIAQLDGLLATPCEKSPLVIAAGGGGTWTARPDGETLGEVAKRTRTAESALEAANAAAERDPKTSTTWTFVPAADDSLSPIERGRFAHAVRNVVRKDVYPAMRRYRECIHDEVLPRARTDDQPGVSHVAGGGAYYRLCIRRHTSLELSPNEIHEIGLAEVAKIRAEIAELGQKVFGTPDVAEIQRRLRTDPALHFTTAAQIEATARATLARAETAVPGAFGIQPKAPCTVVPIPAHEAPFTTVAYYREPAADGSRPGRYYINTFEPTTRPRYEAEVLAFHEAVPGHHTQIAIAQELGALPLMRRHSGSTAFVEGWALYTERLCDELGLYSSDVDRLGILSFDAWRACRLVVDTGLHSLGWSRAQAIDYMKQNTLLAENNIANEVDRYIAWPGQALAYKLGQREILSLRAEARTKLGAAFRLADFHDRVLENGAVNLAALREAVERWIARGGTARAGT